MPDNRYWRLGKYGRRCLECGKESNAIPRRSQNGWYLIETIIVYKDLCSRCGICSIVCTAAIIDPSRIAKQIYVSSKAKSFRGA